MEFVSPKSIIICCMLFTTGLVSRLSRSSLSATEQAERVADKHIAVLCSDCEIRCVSLPSQNNLYKERFQDGLFVVKAEAIIVKGMCYFITI